MRAIVMRGEEINWAAHIEAVARKLCGEPNALLSSRDELRFGTNGSLRVTISGPLAGTWRDHENGISGGVLALIRHKLSVTNGAAVEWLKTGLHIENIDMRKSQPDRAPAQPQRVLATYRYHDEHGNVLYRVLRFGPNKTFAQNPPDGKGGWITGGGCMNGVRRVPYWLNEWLWHPDRAIFIVEGEKDVDRLRSLGLLATCNVGGSGNWLPEDKGNADEFVELFKGRTVIALPDNDKVGRGHADDIVRSLLPVAAEIKVVALPGIPEKGDVSDWLDAGGDRDALLALVRAAAPVREVPLAENVVPLRRAQPKGPEDDDDDGSDEPVEGNAYVPNDIGNALMLVERHGRLLRYVLGVGWHMWDGMRYALDPENVAAQKCAHEISGALIEIARDEPDKDRRGKKLKWAIGCGNSSRINGMLAQAKSYLSLRSDDLDTNHLLLNCHNGTVDLTTGDLREHSHNDLITKLCSTDYDPRATCPRWEQFMMEIFSGDTSMVEFVQRAVGYSITGLTKEQVIFIMHGAGSNGKSVFHDIIAAVMGDYHGSSAADTWVSKPTGAPSNDVAALAGSRFVSVMETEHENRLAESLVKQATGGDRMKVRFMYREFFEFMPQFKLWFATNHKPKIRGSDFAIWRRIILLPFLVTFNDKDKLMQGQQIKDPGLKDKLTQESQGILAWMIRGCLAWQAQGLNPPETVIAATESYQDSQDNVSAFVRDNCWLGHGLGCAAGDLYGSYQLWCSENEEDVISNKAFARNLDERGLPPGQRTKKARTRNGIDLKEESKTALAKKRADDADQAGDG